MENTQKTPEQWFMQLREPYRSEAIANIDKNCHRFNEYPDTLHDSIDNSFFWNKTKQGIDYWDKLYNSIKAGETTYLEPETLTPEQMESGKWYVVESINNYVFVVRFKFIDESTIRYDKAWSFYLNSPMNSTYLLHISKIKSIRPATKEEVLKYFPDEVFEPKAESWKADVSKEAIHYKPENIKTEPIEKGCPFDENVSLINEVNNSQVPEQQKEKWSEKIDEIIDTHVVQKLKPEPIELRPEEKKLLLAEEEPTDWKSKYNELQAKYEKLLAYNDELTERINQTETKNNQEKVYFYLEDMSLGWTFGRNKESAINLSQTNCNIYEAYCIGKKKSVLVSE